VPRTWFRRLSAVTLAFTVAVILWGAYVRASGSGAGCGSHWPTCNGEVIPHPHSVATLIELGHRTTSGLDVILIVAQLVLAFRLFPRGHGVRRAATAAAALIVTEALLGAGLVLFEMVAGNKSVARGAWVGAHLLNTFALLAAVALTGWRARPAERDQPFEPVELNTAVALYASLAAALLVGVTGGIAALGDTLFPVRTFADGWRQDLSPAAHLFVRLRVLHPMLAAGLGAGLLALTGSMLVRDRPAHARGAATLVAALVVVQLVAGLVNLALLAPIPMQIAHLLLADLVWIALVRLCATVAPRTRAALGVTATAAQPASASLSARRG